MEYKIEKNVPIPAPREKHDNYPFKMMDVGDSFSMGVFDAPTAKKRSAVVHSYGKRLGMKFAVRRSPVGELRVWRIE